MSSATETTLSPESLDVLRRLGNPFRNYFARNPDDEVCARYHVPELFAEERRQLLAIIDLYRYDPTSHSEMVPVLGNKGAGKTHLLYSIKHGHDGGWQLLVTPGTYQKDTDFLEYLLFQVIDTLLSGGRQRGARPLEYVSEQIGRRLLIDALQKLPSEQRAQLFPLPALGRWAQRLGLGITQIEEKIQWLVDNLSAPVQIHPEATERTSIGGSLRRLCGECELDPERAYEVASTHIEQTEARNTGGLMRRHIKQGLLRAALLDDESALAEFLTYGFAELDFRVRPSRQDLVLILFKALMEVFVELKTPVVVAFDQLEDLLLARRSDDCHRIAETFFAGIVQVMHQIEGICFLIFAERGLWNRFVPSLDGYIQDRLNNPLHVPGYGTIKALRLEAPSPELLRRVVEARLAPSLRQLPDAASLPTIYPFTEEQIQHIARTEPTLRDMLQQFRQLFDYLVYGQGTSPIASKPDSAPAASSVENRLPKEAPPAKAKSVIVVEVPESEQSPPSAATAVSGIDACTSTPNEEQWRHFAELWDQEVRAGKRKLEPDGALAGAARELQAGLGSLLQVCFEHGVKVGPWRLQHVVAEITFGDHPTYGAVSLAHWVCKDGDPWRVGIGLFLGKGGGKLKDLETKLSVFEVQPPMVDHLILLRPDDDVRLTGKTKACWDQAELQGHSIRLEPVSLDGFAMIYAFPRWMTAISEGLGEGQELPNLADLIQDKCERLLEQVCMPVP